MTSIVTVANLKGGVGKSTTTVNLASSYAALDKKVLVLDLDFQANTTNLLGIDEDAVKKSGSVAQAIKEEWSFDRVLIKSEIPNIDVVGSSIELENMRDSLVGQPNQFKIVDTLLDTPAANEYDIILIDTHPTLDPFLQSALASSHYYLVPLFPEADSIKGIGHQVQVAERIKKHLNPMLMFLGCVITKFDKRNATHLKFDAVLRHTATEGKFRVFNTNIPFSNSVAAASAHSVPLNHYKKDSPATAAYVALAGEILPLLKGKRTGRATAPIRTEILENVDDIGVGVEV